MADYTLEIELLSDTAFGMGAGVSGVVDNEIQQDTRGLPTLSGRALKGLLVNQCSEILFALPEAKRTVWAIAALRLFGQRGEMLEDVPGVFIPNATIAPDLAQAIHQDQDLSPQEVMNSLTVIRRQTAMNALGAPQDETLRAVRVLVRGLKLYTSLAFTREPDPLEKALLAACVMSLRQAGLHRNRGKGRLKLRITNRPLDPLGFSQAGKEQADLAPAWFEKFTQEVTS